MFELIDVLLRGCMTGLRTGKKKEKSRYPAAKIVTNCATGNEKVCWRNLIEWRSDTIRVTLGGVQVLRFFRRLVYTDVTLSYDLAGIIRSEQRFIT